MAKSLHDTFYVDGTMDLTYDGETLPNVDLPALAKRMGKVMYNRDDIEEILDELTDDQFLGLIHLAFGQWLLYIRGNAPLKPLIGEKKGEKIPQSIIEHQKEVRQRVLECIPRAYKMPDERKGRKVKVLSAEESIKFFADKMRAEGKTEDEIVMAIMAKVSQA